PPRAVHSAAQEAPAREQATTPGARFSHGLPPKSDGQMLFLAHCASKLSPAGANGSGGRAAVVSNASPLFTSGAGATSIRKWLLDADLIDAIVALPTDMFYGTGIATYVWILDNNKAEERKGKIQLLDASKYWEPMRKSMGDKRREITEAQRSPIVQAYHAFEDADPTISKVMTPQDFMFLDVPVTKQAHYATKFSPEVVEALSARSEEHTSELQ